MRKQRFSRSGRASSNSSMNPEEYQYHLRQIEGSDPSEQAAGYAWFRKIADQGFSNAMYIAAVCLRDGIGTQQDSAQSVQLLQSSAELEYDPAQFALGMEYLQAENRTEAQAESGLYWLERAVKHHNSDAQFVLGLYLLRNSTDPEKESRGFLLMQESARAGDPHGMFETGRCLLFGLGTETNPEAAVPWILQAAEIGVADAQEFAGMCLIYGTGIEADPEKGVSWLEKAAAQDVPTALYHLGDCYYQGLGVPRSRSRYGRSAVCSRQHSL